MPKVASFETFEQELSRLVGAFERGLGEFKSSGYVEAQLRDDFLNPFWRALGWDLENSAGLVQTKREVEIESRTEIGGRQTRADYLFRTDGHDQFVCEAKKPAEELHARYAFQAKRYAWNKGVPVAVLTDFEEFKIYIVGGRPYIEEPLAGLWKTWRFRELPLVAQEVWNLLAREKIAAGSIEQLLETLPKTPPAKGKACQQWLIKPDRSRSLDVEFLNFLDEARRELGFDLIRHNDRADLLEDNKLNEAVQRIIDRILFLRICEDRDIDTGMLLNSIVQTWGRNYDKEDVVRAHQKPLELHEEPPAGFGSTGLRAPKDSLWRAIVRHFRALDRRPPSHVPFFNGNLFKPHFSEELVVGDGWLVGFIADLSDEESPYLFSYIPVEILGTIYERFLGKVVRPQGRGVTIEEKPDVRKAGGVYYTPRYIVKYIVEQTVEKILRDAKPEATLKLHFLDPACGSGSFLLRVFEVVCEHWEQWFIARPNERKRKWCWVDEKTGNVHLTMALKRQILTSNVFGVDLDPSAVEVTQLSLYLKMLENENRNTLQRQRELLPNDDDPLLPPLENNIQCGNSLIASDFSMIPDDLVRVRAFDWDVGYKDIMKAGGFDAVIGNPPYGMIEDEESQAYCARTYRCTEGRYDLFEVFFEQAIKLAKRSRGRAMFIVPSPVLTNVYSRKLRQLFISEGHLAEITNFGMAVFDDPTVHSCILRFEHDKKPSLRTAVRIQVRDAKELLGSFDYEVSQAELPQGEHAAFDIFVTPHLRQLFQKLEHNAEALSETCYIRQCIKTGDDDTYVATSPKPMPAPWKPSLRGRSIERYDTREKDLYLKYGSWLARNWQNKTFYEVPKIAVRETGNRITATIDEDERYFLSSLYAVYPKDPKQAVSLKYLLGIINSQLATWFVQLIAFGITEGAFTKIRTNQFGRLPVRTIDFKKPADKTRHDKLVSLVDKMLGLAPKLRQARSDSERQTLQNAVTATDQQIDALVYELYGLTEKEIKLVEDNT